MSTTAITPSSNTQSLIAAAGAAAAQDQSAEKLVSADSSQLSALNAQLAQVQSQLAADSVVAHTADAASQAAYIAACQGLASDFGITLPVTIPAPTPTPTPAS